jgi:hypothetical protein
MSEEQLRDETHERWRETLELLGLSPASEAPAENPPAQAAMQAVHEPATQPELTEHVEHRFQTPAHEQHNEIPMAYPTLSPPEAPESFEEDVVPVETEAADIVPGEPREVEEEPRGRGRRRGRRGGRSLSQRRAEDHTGRRCGEPSRGRQPEPELAEEEESRGQEELAPPGGREEEEDIREPESREFTEEENEEDLEEVRAEETTEEDEEPDTLSDWNVPSWQELISSLYRPDR